MESFKSLMSYGEGKVKTTVIIFFSSLLVFLFSLIVGFGFGGAVGIALGVALGIISGILTVVFGLISVLCYIDWLDGK